MAKAERRRHTEAFKRSIVQKVLKGTRSVVEIAEANELSPSMIHTWMRDERWGGGPGWSGKTQILSGLPQRRLQSNGQAAPSKGERRWKYCPNCGERLK